MSKKTWSSRDPMKMSLVSSSFEETSSENQTPQTTKLHSPPLSSPDTTLSSTNSPPAMDMSVLTPIKSGSNPHTLRSPSGIVSGLDDVQEVKTPTTTKGSKNRDDSGESGTYTFDDDEGDGGEDSSDSNSYSSEEEQLEDQENVTPRRRADR